MVKRIVLPISCALALCLAGCAVGAPEPRRARRVIPAHDGPARRALSPCCSPRPALPPSSRTGRRPRSPSRGSRTGPLAAGLPAPLLLDKVDAAPPLSPTFGEHAAAAAGGVFGVLYIDREREDKSVLKLAIGAPGAAEWRMDILEPFGRPVALLPSPDGRFGSLWAGQAGLLYRPSSGPDQVLRADFQARGEGFRLRRRPKRLPVLTGFLRGCSGSGQKRQGSRRGKSRVRARCTPPRCAMAGPARQAGTARDCSPWPRTTRRHAGSSCSSSNRRGASRERP